MQKYLVTFSYLGTRLRGAQTQLAPSSDVHNFEDPTTVQGLFNMALRHIKPANQPIFILSSRTDTGVHALSSTGHVELLHRHHEEGRTYEPTLLAQRLNRFFSQRDVDISVHSMRRVPAALHARHSACERSYLYRVGVLPPSDGGRPPTPVSERHRSWILQAELCASRLDECARLLSGEHDFATFMGSQRGQCADVRTVRQLHVHVTPTVAPLGPPQLRMWHLHFRSRSFLYRQVRRLVGAMVAVASGRLALDDVRRMLDTPGKESWNPRARCAPPDGLYLVGVRYPDECLVEGEDPRPGVMETGQATDGGSGGVLVRENDGEVTASSEHHGRCLNRVESEHRHGIGENEFVRVKATDGSEEEAMLKNASYHLTVSESMGTGVNR